MKILVLQLARLGDIYQTWPALNALRRLNPEAEIHLLVRARFQGATEGLRGITVHVLPTAEILEPVLVNGDESGAQQRLDTFLDPLSKGDFDRIINLSFSPASSYLTDILASDACAVSGYTRHADGYLQIPDDSSAYFYAQVGVGRANRYHLCEVFAAVCGVALASEDFGPYAVSPRAAEIVLHLGASQVQKAYPAELWVETLRALSSRFAGQLVLIGSADERALAERVQSEAGVIGVCNLTGETTLPQTFARIAQAQLLIGADSAPVHIANLTGTPVLNLSSSTVNFWETGPLSAGSRVLYADLIASLKPVQIAEEASAMIQNQAPRSKCYVRPAWDQTYQPSELEADDFDWNLVQALYTGSAFPEAKNQGTKIAFQRLFELAQLALMQLATWDQPTAAGKQILASVDELLEEIPRLNRQVIPVIQWFQTQRLRMKPDTEAATLQATRKLFEELLWVAAVYHQTTDNTARAASLCETCAPHLREYDFAAIEGDFQDLVASLQDLAQHSNAIGPRPWSVLLTRMDEALARRDYIELADQIEFELRPYL